MIESWRWRPRFLNQKQQKKAEGSTNQSVLRLPDLEIAGLAGHVVKEFAAKIGVSKLAPHDLRCSCARLCRAAGGELEQIHFLLGHVWVQTTERYLGCTQRISSAVNDRIGIEPKP